MGEILTFGLFTFVYSLRHFLVVPINAFTRISNRITLTVFYVATRIRFQGTHAVYTSRSTRCKTQNYGLKHFKYIWASILLTYAISFIGRVNKIKVKVILTLWFDAGTIFKQVTLTSVTFTCSSVRITYSVQEISTFGSITSTVYVDCRAFGFYNSETIYNNSKLAQFLPDTEFLATTTNCETITV